MTCTWDRLCEKEKKASSVGHIDVAQAGKAQCGHARKLIDEHVPEKKVRGIDLVRPAVAAKAAHVLESLQKRREGKEADKLSRSAPRGGRQNPMAKKSQGAQSHNQGAKKPQ